MKNLRLSDTFMKLQMKNIHHVNTISNVFSLLNEEIEQKLYTKGKSHIVYKCVEEISEYIFSEYVMFSLLLKIDGKREPCFICKDDDQLDSLSIHKIICDDENGYMICNQWYTSISIKHDVYKTATKEEILSIFLIDYLLFIPTYDNDEKYTVISKEWLCRKRNGEYALPSFSSELYEKFIKR